MNIKQSKKTMLRRAALDTVLSVLGSLGAILTMRGVSEAIPGFIILVSVWLGAAVVFSVLGFSISRSGDVVTRYASLRGYSRLFNAILIKEAGMILMIVLGLIKLPSIALSLVVILADILLSTMALLFPRLLVRSVRREEREIKAVTGRLNALVSGTDDAAIAMAEDAEASDHYNILGYLSDDPAQTGKVIGERIVYYADSNETLNDLQWRLGGIDCILFPKGRGKSGPGAAESDKMPANNDAMSVAGHAVKRSIDIVGSGLLMIIFSPLAALSALAVKLEDGGPAIYRQERLGRGGKPFNILKFRSMRIDAEAAGMPAL